MTTDVTIREVLVPALEAAFAGSGMRVSTSPDPVAVFPAACAEVGDVQIYDDGDEATVVIENVTHHHSNPYDSGMSPRERAEWVTQEVVEFLRALFDESFFPSSRSAFFPGGPGGRSSPHGRRGGGRRNWVGGRSWRSGRRSFRVAHAVTPSASFAVLDDRARRLAVSLL